MKDQKIEEKIIAWFQGDLGEADGKALLEEVKISSKAKELFETYQAIYQDIEEEELVHPQADFKERFYQEVVESEKVIPITKKKNSDQMPRFWFLKYAAAILLFIIVGILIGLNISKNQQLNSMSDEMLALRSDMKNLLQNESTALRIKAVKMSNELETTDPEILKVLIQTMNSDKSDNVRLAAIDALENFSNEKIVRKAFFKTLEKEDQDFIQIKIIRILTQINDKKTLPYLDQIIESKTASKYLRTEATEGKKKLINL